MKFEEALKRLGEIVQQLESSDCALDESLKLFEEGVKLTRACHSQISEAEKKIEILTKADPSGIETKPFAQVSAPSQD